MKQNKQNFKHSTGICTECKSHEILVDEHHGEVFCNRCGLVLKTSQIQKIK